MNKSRKIISSNRKYSSWQEILKKSPSTRLMCRILYKCLSKFKDECAGHIYLAPIRGGRRARVVRKR